ncbi:HrpB1 family type III secretion system apparatus protein [Paraburkholderia rhizosphaerae]|uniref:Type III secretion protein HrpB1 n=1 Tax=Paraburkholderia rhizosphaerae TaxID=480658 RepID=A0A4R8LKT1_9BURK|nr:HrpB1 family type III secretion system apparatus protein [Paraburkholderia rhizosphaerae]TDY45163.1 type III secretion protein HrpB1 [Paraburkholderia rhizosphaerae]
MNQKRDYMDCSPELFGALIELVRMSVVDQFPTTRVDVEDVEHLLEAMHTMRPNLVELSLFDGFLHVVRGNWREATDVFGALAGQSLCMPGSKAMMIYCLSSSGNADWQVLASQLLDDGAITPEARMLVHAVIARNDVEQAGEDALSSGQFVEPESLKRLRTDTAGTPAEASSAAPGGLMPFDGQYLRL